MAIRQLTEEQVRTMSPEEKDRWWLENVWRGDMPQLTIRSALTGMILGGVLSLTNLYIGIQTGWTLGVGITSVILAFAAFKVLSRAGLGHEMTILENNAMQSIATAAGYMTAPLVTSLSAYMIITNRVIPMNHIMIWMISLSILGVLFAFPRPFEPANDVPFGHVQHVHRGRNGILKPLRVGNTQHNVVDSSGYVGMHCLRARPLRPVPEGPAVGQRVPVWVDRGRGVESDFEWAVALVGRHRERTDRFSIRLDQRATAQRKHSQNESSATDGVSISPSPHHGSETL